MASKVMLIIANNHMDLGGRPVKKSRINDRTPLMITCQPMATYFSGDCLRSRFHSACRMAEVSSSTMARMDMAKLNLPHKSNYPIPSMQLLRLGVRFPLKHCLEFCKSALPCHLSVSRNGLIQVHK